MVQCLREERREGGREGRVWETATDWETKACSGHSTPHLLSYMRVVHQAHKQTKDKSPQWHEELNLRWCFCVLSVWDTETSGPVYVTGSEEIQLPFYITSFPDTHTNTNSKVGGAVQLVGDRKQGISSLFYISPSHFSCLYFLHPMYFYFFFKSPNSLLIFLNLRVWAIYTGLSVYEIYWLSLTKGHCSFSIVK